MLVQVNVGLATKDGEQGVRLLERGEILVYAWVSRAQ